MLSTQSTPGSQPVQALEGVARANGCACYTTSTVRDYRIAELPVAIGGVLWMLEAYLRAGLIIDPATESECRLFLKQ